MVTPPLSDTAEEVLRWAAQRYQPRIALTCSFGGPGGMVLAHMLSRWVPQIPIVFIDTGFLFPETYALRYSFAQQYGLQVMDYTPELTPEEQAEQYGEQLWDKDPDACCHMRKVRPMQRVLESVDAWITALRRDQSPTRADITIVEEHVTSSGSMVVKINPLAHWNRQQVWDYLYEYQVPYNPLLDDGYKSIGCIQCTVRPNAAAHERAGRWNGHEKIECGLHTFTQKAGPSSP